MDAIGHQLSFKNLFLWAWTLWRSPRDFYARLAKGGGDGTPLCYALFWLFMGVIIEECLGFLRPAAPPVNLWVQLGWLLLGPWVLLLLGFAVSALFFVVWHLMGSPENYQVAFRCWAFMTPVGALGAVLGVVPYANAAVFVYGIILLIIASVELHKRTARRAGLVWGCLGALFFLLWALSVFFQRALSTQPLVLPAVDPSLTETSEEAIRKSAQDLHQQMKKDLANSSKPPRR